MNVLPAKILDRVAAGAFLRALGPWHALRDAFTDYDRVDDVREIVCVKFWGIGNAALMLPSLHALRRRYPRARVTVVTLAGNEPLFAGAADRVWTVRSRPLRGCVTDLAGVLSRLRRMRIDLAIDFEQYVKTSQLLLFLANARQVVAFDTPGQKRTSLAHATVPYDARRHTADAFFDLVRAAGVEDRAPSSGGLAVDSAAAARISAQLGASSSPVAVLHPGSGDNFPGRRWPAERFREVAQRLGRRGVRVLVTGTPAERELAASVAADGAAEDWSGRLDLPELVALLARADVLVSNDTGPVHLASALEVPVIALYGPNTPELYGPRSAGSVSFFDPPPCAPCITNTNYKTSRCRNPVCMLAITVESVTAAALARVEAASARRGRRAGGRA